MSSGKKVAKYFLLLAIALFVTTCASCMDSVFDDCPHIYGEWYPIVAADCQTEGADSRTCSLCFHIENRVLPKTDHSYGTAVITLRPTCIDEGTAVKRCSVCGTTQTVTLPVNPSAHQWGKQEIHSATCTEPGESIRKCELCDKKDTEVLPPTHTFSDDLTCHDRTCTVCGDTISGDGNHHFINDACACGTPHPDFTLSKAAARVLAAQAATMEYIGDISLSVSSSAQMSATQDLFTYFPAQGLLSFATASDDAAAQPTYYTLLRNGTLYYYDLSERKAYRTDPAMLRRQISINTLFGKELTEFLLPQENVELRNFSFDTDGNLTLTAQRPLFGSPARFTYTVTDGKLSSLRIILSRPNEFTEKIYRFDYAPANTTMDHPNGVRDSDFTVLESYSVKFEANIDAASHAIRALTGEASPLPIGDTALSDKQITGWFYDSAFTEPYAQSTVPFTPFPITVYAATAPKPNTVYLSLHIVGAELSPKKISFPVGNTTVLSDSIDRLFPAPAVSSVSGLYLDSAYTVVGAFADAACITPLTPERLSAGESVAYLKVEPYAALTLAFPKDLDIYPPDLTFTYPKRQPPSVPASSFLDAVQTVSEYRYTLWLDPTFTQPYVGTLQGETLYLKHIPHENFAFVDYRHAETQKLLNRLEVELNQPVFLSRPFDFDDPEQQIICSGIWFNAECTASAVGVEITPETNMTLYCTFEAAPAVITFDSLPCSAATCKEELRVCKLS